MSGKVAIFDFLVRVLVFVDRDSRPGLNLVSLSCIVNTLVYEENCRESLFMGLSTVISDQSRTGNTSYALTAIAVAVTDALRRS